MENQFLDQDAQNYSNASGLSSIDKEYLFIAAKWSRFLGIVGFVMTGIVVIAAIGSLFLGSIFSKLGEGSPYSSSAFAGLGSILVVIYGIAAAIYFFISLYLYNFGVKTKQALNENDSNALTEGLKNLKSFFSLSGILAAIVVGLYGIIIVFGLIGAMFMR